MDDLTLERRLEAKDKQIAELVEALESIFEYATHLDHCDIYTGEGLNTDCTCGFLSMGIRAQDAIHKGEQA